MATAPSKPSIGIDLGTSFSCVAVFRDGRPEVIPNSQGDRITPSVVAFTDSGRLVGESAVPHKVLDPVNVIYNAKRFIGRRWGDPRIKENSRKFPFTVKPKGSKFRFYPFNVVQNGNRLQFKVKHKKVKTELAPEQISAAVLKKMKKT